MADVAAIPTYLSATFPKLPDEIREYVFSKFSPLQHWDVPVIFTAVLKENADDLSSIDEVVEAVGDHLQASTPGLKEDRVSGCPPIHGYFEYR